jgi:hypothetical protein
MTGVIMQIVQLVRESVVKVAQAKDLYMAVSTHTTTRYLKNNWYFPVASSLDFLARVARF